MSEVSEAIAESLRALGGKRISGNSAERAFGGGQFLPFAGKGGRRERIADQPPALGRTVAFAAVRPFVHLCARKAHAVEQQFQMILRMAFDPYRAFIARIMVARCLGIMAERHP